MFAKKVFEQQKRIYFIQALFRNLISIDLLLFHRKVDTFGSHDIPVTAV